MKADSDIIVIGAGAAGLLAAAAASTAGARTILLEKSRKTGVKILMSGGTRCNITHDTDWRGIARAFGGAQERFLKFALAQFTPAHTVEFFQSIGVATKVEEAGKVFPVSDRAVEVRDALVRHARQSGASIQTGQSVTALNPVAEGFQVVAGQQTLHCRCVIVTTGGLSYPGCGTTGDGYQWLTRLGHTIAATRPALTPIFVNDPWARGLSGVTLPDVRVEVRGSTHRSPRRIDRGSFLFTHRGCSGPVVLNVSREAASVLEGHEQRTAGQPLQLVCDWVPEMKEERWMTALVPAVASGRPLGAVLAEEVSLPRRVIESLCEVAGVDWRIPLAELGKRRAAALYRLFCGSTLTVCGIGGYAKAEVTAGGIALNEVDPMTMASRRIAGLYLAGEILDVDGPIGGYNFQAAWSTGRLAGLSAAASLSAASLRS